jgi:RNA polymerase sigma-70 factor (ECF subfamily)
MTSSHSERKAQFYRLVWPHAGAVLRVARILTHRDSDADDLSQETMLKAFNAMESLREGVSAKSWLLSILRNCHIDRTRVTKPMLSIDAEELDPQAKIESEPGPAHRDVEALLDSFSDEQVIAALRQLPEAIRWTLLLTDVEGLDDAEVAALLNVPAGTIKSRLHRGRRMLYQSLLPLAKTLRLAI